MGDAVNPAAAGAADEPVQERSAGVVRMSGGGMARWAMLCLFPIGLLVTPEAYREGDGALGFAALTWVGMAACALLLTRLGRPLRVTLPVWVILAVYLVGYYLKYYWMTWAVEYSAEWPFARIFLEPVGSPDLMFRSYQVITLGFTAFCVAGWMALGRREPLDGAEALAVPEPDDPAAGRRLARQGAVILILLVPVMVVTGIVQYAARIGVAGVEPMPLPFGVATLVFSTRTVAIPALLLLLVWLADGRGVRVLTGAALAMLVVHGFTQMLLSSSRGTLLMMVLPVAFLWMRTGRFSRARRNTVIAIFLGVALLHPVITQYRLLRVAGDASQFLGAFFEAASTSAGLWVTMSTGITSIIARVTGTESLAFAVRVDDPGVSLENLSYYLDPERGLARVFTQDVVNYGTAVVTHLSAPSLLGALYLLAGKLGVVVGSLLWPLVWIALWRGLQRLPLRSYPVAQSLLLLLAFSFTSEGDLDGLPLRLAIYGVSLAACEVLTRVVTVSPSPVAGRGEG